MAVGTPAEDDAPVGTAVGVVAVVVVAPSPFPCALDAPTPVVVVVAGAGAVASTEKLVPVVTVTSASFVVCPYARITCPDSDLATSSAAATVPGDRLEYVTVVSAS